MRCVATVAFHSLSSVLSFVSLWLLSTCSSFSPLCIGLVFLSLFCLSLDVGQHSTAYCGAARCACGHCGACSGRCYGRCGECTKHDCCEMVRCFSSFMYYSFFILFVMLLLFMCRCNFGDVCMLTDPMSVCLVVCFMSAVR